MRRESGASGDVTKLSVAGILDFQDCGYGYKVYDVAIYMIYAMVHCRNLDSMQVAGQCLAGYLKERSLSERELDVLYYCMTGRLAQSVVMGNYYYSIYKDPYLLVTAAPGWGILQLLLTYTPADALAQWNKVVETSRDQ